MLTLALAAAALIPPPPGWTPPQARGPGTFCGITFSLELGAGEVLAMQWPGEVFINDVYGTFHVTTPRGVIIVSEDGARTRPSGASRPAANSFRNFPAARAYAMPVRGHASVKSVTVRFPDGMPQAVANAFLERVDLGRGDEVQCLHPENR